MIDFDRFRADHERRQAGIEARLAAERRGRGAQRKADDRRFQRRTYALIAPVAVLFLTAFTGLRYVTASFDPRDGALTDVIFIVVFAAVIGRTLYWWGTRPERKTRR
ncbi:MAG: hypothetical protein ACRDQA_07465 [Nocardioidaceae bacterium]